VPAFVGDGLQAVQQGAQSRQKLVGQGFRRKAKEQVAIGGVSGGAQQGEGEDQRFGVKWFASFGAGAWRVLGELKDGVIEGACGQGAKRDRSVSAFHRVEYTPPHPLFSNTLYPP